MARAKTNSQYIEECQALHNFRYDYSKVGYRGNKSVVTVTCAQHGDFSIRANNHLLGVGCKECGVQQCSAARTKDFKHFEDTCNKLHNNRYTYSSVGYVNTSSKVNVHCDTHGTFIITAYNHMSGKGCPICAVDKSRGDTESFISTAKQKHPNAGYEYNLVTYVGSREKVEIVCQLHGSFWQSPAAHLQGCGCPSCSITGFDDNKAGTFYVLTCGELTKIGITNRLTKERLAQLSRSGKRYEVIAEFKFKDGSIARKIEAKFLRKLREDYTSPTDKFDGYTECFYDVDTAKLLSEIYEETST